MIFSEIQGHLHRAAIGAVVALFVGGMDQRNGQQRRRQQELIEAFDREREAARDLTRRHAELVRHNQQRDRQVFIERRRHPR